MYLLQQLFGDNFNRINNIITQHINMLNGTINLIASASYPFPEVLQALCYPFFVFPVEGIPTKRYFPGVKVIDDIENTGEILTKKLFNLSDEYKVTIQPHSGTQANQIVFNAILKPNDLVLSMQPSHGGHISHTVLIGKRNPVIHYNLNRNGWIDYNDINDMTIKYKPKLIIAGTSSYPREINFQKIGEISNNNNSFLLADISHTALFIASGEYKNIFPFVDFATFTFGKNLRGPHGGVVIFKNKFLKKISYSIFPKTQGGPMQQTLFAKLVCLTILNNMDLKIYSNKIIRNAREIATILINKGINIISNGTDSHIILIDLRELGLTGINIEKRFEKYSIFLNRNLVPDDKKPPWITSGIRLGTTGITILGYQFNDIQKLANIISNIILKPQKPLQKEIFRLINKYHINIANVEKE
jgi:glycine hydroxymethyltransferase